MRSSKGTAKSSTRNSPPVSEERVDYRILGDAPIDGTLTLRQLDEQDTELRLHTEYDRQKVSELYHLDEQEPADTCRTGRRR